MLKNRALGVLWLAVIIACATFGCSANGSGAATGGQTTAGTGNPSTGSNASATITTGSDTVTTGGGGSGEGGGAGASGTGGASVGTGGSGAGGSGVDASAGAGGGGGSVDGGAGPANWPQAAGPSGTWRVPEATGAPVKWSVSTGQGVVWKGALPNEGQGGIAVWGDKIFLETFVAAATGNSNAIQGHAIDRATGKILWSVPLTGGRASPVAYSYSDATSWSPITDGTYVWFFNSTGEMGCWDFSGKEIWRRKFPEQPSTFPFNRQHEPILVNDTIVTLEPLVPADPGYRADQADWNYLRGLDKLTGKTKWIAEDASTFFNTAVMGKMADGKPAILHGRGGPHAVPEVPIGLSMTSLAPGSEGKSLWRYTPTAQPGGPVDGATFMALYTMTWDEKYAYWFRNVPEESHLVIDANTGQLVKTQSLIANVDVRQWDTATNKYVLHANVNIRSLPDPTYPLSAGQVLHVLPNWHSNIVDHGYHYFFTSTNNRRSSHAPAGHSGPAHCIGRVNVETGKVEYLEVPVGIDRPPQMPEMLVYGKALTTVTNNAQGQDIAGDARSHKDGWETPAFFASPISLGGQIYMGTTMGITYVVNAGAAVLDDKAILGYGDLGRLGQAWSLGGPSYAGGILYHRSLKEVVALKAGP